MNQTPFKNQNSYNQRELHRCFNVYEDDMNGFIECFF